MPATIYAQPDNGPTSTGTPQVPADGGRLHGVVGEIHGLPAAVDFASALTFFSTDTTQASVGGVWA